MKVFACGEWIKKALRKTCKRGSEAFCLLIHAVKIIDPADHIGAAFLGDREGGLRDLFRRRQLNAQLADPGLAEHLSGFLVRPDLVALFLIAAAEDVAAGKIMQKRGGIINHRGLLFKHLVIMLIVEINHEFFDYFKLECWYR